MTTVAIARKSCPVLGGTAMRRVTEIRKLSVAHFDAVIDPARFEARHNDVTEGRKHERLPGSVMHEIQTAVATGHGGCIT
jgi:hypothetical protein